VRQGLHIFRNLLNLVSKFLQPAPVRRMLLQLSKSNAE
jgi:hypothetical protein